MYPEKTGKQRNVFLEALKQASSEIPVLAQFVKTWEKVEQDERHRNIAEALSLLEQKIVDLEALFSDEWLKSPEGDRFARKVFDSAIDAQLADKQELFVNALINGIQDKETKYQEKLKFVDTLRHLSRPSLDILAEIHKMFKDKVRGPGRNVDPAEAYPHIDRIGIAERLSTAFHPHMITSAIYEMESQGLFFTIGQWNKQSDGSYRAGGGFATELTYTDFTCRFVEFITFREQKKLKVD